jgi:thiamine biosynthesis lipoprotein
MGTLFTATLYAPDSQSASRAAQDAFHRIDQLEDVMSDYQADSDLNLLSASPVGKAVPVSQDLFDVIQKAQKISRQSKGTFDITVGPYVRLWRFARKRKVLPTAQELEVARGSVGYQNLRLNEKARTVTLLAPNMRLDLGGIAKGYAADQALGVLRSNGLPRALIAASGDIAIGDPPPGQPGWRIGVASIDARTNELSQAIWLRNAAISTSGDTEQFIEIDGVRYSHIISPKTGLGLTHRIQATIVAPDATTTDSIATTVCILGVEEGLRLVEKLPRTSALILTKDGMEQRTYASRRFEAIPKTASTPSGK